MRLNTDQVETIREAAEAAFGPGSRVSLFGSRVDDEKRGGDIDLLITPATRDDTLRRKIRFLVLLERTLGERRIDVLIAQPDDQRDIVRVARETGVRL
ncbi:MULTISPECIES: nucleotidyltransferase domain-containing protein [unclassified Thiocapsa]|uniref:nucleotidyltransferase domain-containing protein n=1 Tax=unclassified Thiocapsa TaxID=2641286 RepID=UPI0035B311E1